MEQIYAGVLGAVIGAVITGLIAWRLQKHRSKEMRDWQVALKVAQALGSILSAYTPDSVRTKEDVWKMQEEWGKLSRELHILGFGGSGDPLNRVINDYFQALIRHVEKKMKRGELEHRRAEAKDKAARLMEKYTGA